MFGDLVSHVSLEEEGVNFGGVAAPPLRKVVTPLPPTFMFLNAFWFFKICTAKATFLSNKK